MSSLDLIKKSNENKPLFEIGDICISKKFGAGKVIEIEQDDVWYPIHVRFKQNYHVFGEKYEKEIEYWYNSQGETERVEGKDVEFYKKMF